MNTRKIAISALLTAVACVFLILSVTVPTAKIALFFISTVAISMVVVAADKKTAALAYVATSVIGFLIFNIQPVIVAFIGFFGYYVILKSLIEKLDKLVFEWIIKVLLYCIVLPFAQFFIPNIPLWIYLVSIAAFVVYDILLSYVMTYITRHFSGILRK